MGESGAFWLVPQKLKDMKHVGVRNEIGTDFFLSNILEFLVFVVGSKAPCSEYSFDYDIFDQKIRKVL